MNDTNRKFFCCFSWKKELYLTLTVYIIECFCKSFSQTKRPFSSEVPAAAAAAGLSKRPLNVRTACHTEEPPNPRELSRAQPHSLSILQLGGRHDVWTRRSTTGRLHPDRQRQADRRTYIHLYKIEAGQQRHAVLRLLYAPQPLLGARHPGQPLVSPVAGRQWAVPDSRRNFDCVQVLPAASNQPPRLCPPPKVDLSREAGLQTAAFMPAFARTAQCGQRLLRTWLRRLLSSGVGGRGAPRSRSPALARTCPLCEPRCAVPRCAGSVWLRSAPLPQQRMTNTKQGNTFPASRFKINHFLCFLLNLTWHVFRFYVIDLYLLTHQHIFDLNWICERKFFHLRLTFLFWWEN